MIGLTVLITLLVLFFGINYLKGVNLFKASNYYFVSYTNVAGLAQSAPVTVNGYKVGLVREIQYEYDNPGHVLVEISLDKQLRVPQGTEAVLVCDMLGTASIELKMGNGTDFQEIGSRLQGKTQPGLVDNLAGDLMPGITAVIPKVDSLLTAVTLLASDPALRAAIGRLDAITANLETMTKSLNATATTLPGIATAADSTMHGLSATSDNLAVLSGQLKDLPIDSTFSNIQALSAELRTMSAALNSNESSLGLLMHDPGLYRNLNAAAGSLDSLLIDVKRNPKRYISIKLL